ncbi:MAG: HepT-like ribonuclease domain-containing protein [Planctomycetota bacterium]
MSRDVRAYLSDVIESCDAIAAIARMAPKVFDAIVRARRIVDFRNQLTHEYQTVDNALVWAIIEYDVPVLRRECTALILSIAPNDEEPE